MVFRQRCTTTGKGARLQPFEVFAGLVEFGEQAFFGLELARVDAAAAGTYFDGVLEVEHLVVQQVFDRVTRGVGAIEDPTDDDGVVGGVVVAEHAAGNVSAPGKGGATAKAVEEAVVHRLEDLFEVVVAALGGADALAAAGLADAFRLPAYGFGLRVATVAV